MSSIWTIRRSVSDAKLTGLCGGIAQHWGVDPVLVRVGCALLALSGGIGLILYLAGWLLVPVEGKTDAPIHDLLGDQVRRWSREVWIGLVAVACIAVFAVFGSLTPFGFGPAGILALVWYFGYYKSRRASSGATTYTAPPAVPAAPEPPRFYRYSGPATPFTEAADAWRQRVEQVHQTVVQPPFSGGYGYRAAAVEDAVPEPVGPAESLAPTPPPGLLRPGLPAPDVPSTSAGARFASAQVGQDPAAEAAAQQAYLAIPDPVGLYGGGGSVALAPTPAPVRRGASSSARRLRLVCLVVLGLTLSGLGVADGHGVAIPAAGYLGATLLVLGLTLVAATWLGRARGILLLALLVLPATLVTSALGPVAQERGWGVRQVAYTSPAQLSAGDQLELGQLKVDLTRLSTRANAHYTAHVDFGALEVRTPPGMNVVVSYRFKSGAYYLNGTQVRGGSPVAGTVPAGVADPRKKTLTLDLSVDRGAVQVER